MSPLMFLLALQALRGPTNEASATPSAIASATAADAASAASCDREFSCASCSQVQFCRRGPSGLKEAYRVTCGGDKPFCDRHTGACVETAPKGCAEVGFFTCMRDGVFPDPDDCISYHVCEQGVSHTFKCATGQYFNGTACDSSSYCSAPISCAGKSGIKVAHSHVKNIFAYCLNNKTLFVDKCEDNWILDGKTQKCLPDCQSGRMHADPSDPMKYFRCTQLNPDLPGHYELVSEICPPDTRFIKDCQACCTCKSCPNTTVLLYPTVKDCQDCY